MIRKAEDVRLNVLPIYFGLQHKAVYEGPCRGGVGDELKPEFDAMMNSVGFEQFKGLVDEKLSDELFNNLKPLKFCRTDEWELPEEWFDQIQDSMNETDVIFIKPCIGHDGIVQEILKRFGKPVVITPETVYPCSGLALSAAIEGMNKDYIFGAFISWEETIQFMRALRAKKVVANFHLLGAARMDSRQSMSAVDCIADQTYASEKLGMQFRFVNIHELMDQMTPAVEGGNPTTPGRITDDLTEEDIAEAERLADELIAGADEVQIKREYLVSELCAYLTVKKTMARWDCNGFTMPCPDSCSTRRLDQNSFTPCFIHSLLQREGIPSACEYDTSTALTEQALIGMTGQHPYNGNLFSIFRTDGEWPPAAGLAEKDIPLVIENEEHTLSIHHSVPHNFFVDPKKGDNYCIRTFTMDRQFGPAMRYDFGKLKGDTVTLCRIAPDLNHMFIERAIILCNDGYERTSCNGGFVFTVEDRKKFWNAAKRAGNHICAVYGDYVEDMEVLAEMLDMEVIRA